MSYYCRAFCIGDQVPTINEIFQWAKGKGVFLEIDDEIKVDIHSRDWCEVGICYKENKISILSEVNRDEGEDCLMREEIEEFNDFIHDSEASKSVKKKVLDHLKKTKFIVANQLPTSDCDEDGYEANAIFLQYFEEHCNAYIQYDNEGFYTKNQLILSLD